MNSIWNKNIALFKNRFPQLATILEDSINLFSKFAGTSEEPLLYPFWSISTSKTGIPIAEEKGLRLHSAYNPQRESQSIIASSEKKLQDAEAIVFLGCGLGYTLVCAAEKFSEKQIILIEPDANHFFASMLFVDFEKLFSCQKLVTAICCTPDQVIRLINQNGIEHTCFFSTSSHTAHNQQYFDAVNALIERNRSKEQINKATLKKFGKLWTNNCKKNYGVAKKLEGVNIYKDRFAGKPFLLLAAGPSLEEILPYLERLSKKMEIVCVDTALKACLRVGVEPDFILLTDPQYWAYKHIAGLHAKNSVLITELAAYPAVFRFDCKKIVLCDSQVPMADDFPLPSKGNLGAGGSVASSAWNFCAFCGATEIYVSGLDLSFPNRQTHIKGSTFEENVHTTSKKCSPAETSALPMLFSGNVTISQDYNGKPLLTDQRMQMFAYWFESRLAELPQIKNYVLSSTGLRIPGMTPICIEKIL